MNTSKSETTGYLPFELVYGRLPSNPLDAALGYNGLEELANQTIFTEQVQQWLQKAQKIAIKRVNKTRDKEAPRFEAKRSPAPTYEADDLVLEWKPVSGEGLVTKLLRPWTGPHNILQQVSPVNLKIKPLISRRKFYVVHVERLKRYYERLDFDSAGGDNYNPE